MIAGRTYPKARTESPIEAILLVAIDEEIQRCRLDCSPTTQARIGPYRVDILVEMGGRKLVVECDGAAYHAATKEQVERDKRRDRFFAANDIAVMRFTGAEINRSPRACAAEVGAWIEAFRPPSIAPALSRIEDPAARKTVIMSKWERGEITRLQASRLIRRGGLVFA